MEKSVSIQDPALLLEEMFHLPVKDWEQYSPLTLAYIGDAVFDLVIRTIYVKRANMQAAKLHRKTTNLVKAQAQAKMIAALLPGLNEKEAAIYRRGHNASPLHGAKNASRGEYLEATGYEALIGYLYLNKEYARMLELISQGVGAIGYEF